MVSKQTVPTNLLGRPHRLTIGERSFASHILTHSLLLLCLLCLNTVGSWSRSVRWDALCKTLTTVAVQGLFGLCETVPCPEFEAGRSSVLRGQLVTNRGLQRIGVWSRGVLTHQRTLVSVCQIHLDRTLASLSAELDICGGGFLGQRLSSQARLNLI